MMDKLERRWLRGVQCGVQSEEIMIFLMYVWGDLKVLECNLHWCYMIVLGMS